MCWECDSQLHPEEAAIISVLIVSPLLVCVLVCLCRRWRRCFSWRSATPELYAVPLERYSVPAHGPWGPSLGARLLVLGTGEEVKNYAPLCYKLNVFFPRERSHSAVFLEYGVTRGSK